LRQSEVETGVNDGNSFSGAKIPFAMGHLDCFPERPRSLHTPSTCVGIILIKQIPSFIQSKRL
jgi:hypothetical protein